MALLRDVTFVEMRKKVMVAIKVNVSGKAK